MTSLEIKKDGSVYIQPDNIMVENQMDAHHLISQHHPMTAINSTILCNPGIYPIPDLKWEVRYYFKDDDNPEGWTIVSRELYEAAIKYPERGYIGKQVAILTPSLPSNYGHDWQDQMTVAAGLAEESQEELWQEVTYIVTIGDLRGEDCTAELMKKFTITRKP